MLKLRVIYADFKSKDANALDQNRVETCNRINDVVALVIKRKLEQEN